MASPSPAASFANMDFDLGFSGLGPDTFAASREIKLDSNQPVTPNSKADSPECTGSLCSEATTDPSTTDSSPGLSPRSMLARARASPSRQSRLLDELLLGPEADFKYSTSSEWPAYKSAGLGFDPFGSPSAFGLGLQTGANKLKVLPEPPNFVGHVFSGAWRLPSTIVGNSLGVVGWEDGQIDRFDDLETFVSFRHQNIFEEAWINVSAAVAAAVDVYGGDAVGVDQIREEDSGSNVSFGSMDDPVVDIVPRGLWSWKGDCQSGLNSAGRSGHSPPSSPSPSDRSSSPRWEALTIEPL
ncbi:hypothetical protein FRB90_006982 [Tulasnella sp. 427]|nr:hypothetical protein FRB90_006982 [Tulasnella sp. 427]